VKAVRRAVRAALDLGIEYLTIYSFSVENWSRPAEEVSDLLGLLKRFVRQDLAELDAAGVKASSLANAPISPPIWQPCSRRASVSPRATRE